MYELKFIKDQKFWLIAIGTALIILHLNLTSKSGNSDLFSSSLLFWMAVAFLLEKKHDKLSFKSNISSSLVGIFFISFVLFKSLNLFGNDIFLRILPFLSFLGLGLLASGFKGLKQYWQELSLLGFLIIPPGAISIFLDPSLLTAKFAAFVLLVLGFKVSNPGVFVVLPTGSIEVYHGCSGIALMLQLLGIAFIFLASFNTNIFKKILLPLIAILLAFVVNGLRVAVMAVLVALANQKAFEYWHLGDGSLIFSLVTVLIFGTICVWLTGSENNNSLKL